MSLKEKLQKIAAASAKQIPEASQQIMHTATEKVAASLEARKVPQVGDLLPKFELPDSKNGVVASAELVEQGPFVLSFFRGKW